MIDLKDKRILIISPHPDDEAICAGGLIMRAKKEKAKVFVLFMATGNSRQFINGKTTKQIRSKEAEAASEYGNFDYSIAFTSAATILDTIPQKEMIEAIENMVDEFKPEIVIIPYRNSYNQDHRAVAEACITAFRPMPHSLHHQTNIILEMEEPYGWTTGLVPNFYVEINIEEKILLYYCHNTQIPENPRHPRSSENLVTLSMLRGTNIDVQYAEAYKLIRGYL